MKVRRGDIIIVDHPFSDGSGSKIRPCLVVQNDLRNAILQETIIAPISSSLRHVSDPTQLFIDITTPDGLATGLKLDSVVRCGSPITIHESSIRKKIGMLSVSLMLQIDDCLKIALNLP